jgi:hypothetical protein
MIKNQLPVQELLSCSWLSINCHFSYLRSIFKHSLATEEVVSPETRRSQHREQEDTMFCSGFLSGFVTHLSSQLTYIFLLCTFVLVFPLLFSLQKDKFIFLYVCLSCLSPLLSLLPGLVLISSSGAMDSLIELLALNLLYFAESSFLFTYPKFASGSCSD